MSDIPEKPSESKEETEGVKPPSKDARSLIQKGIPIDDDIRLDLYAMRNRDGSSTELGEMVNGLPKDKQEQVRMNAMGDEEKTSIIDKKGGEILDYPHKPKEQNTDQ